MCLIKTSLLLLIMLVTLMLKTKTCTTKSFKNIDIWVDHNTGKKKMDTVNECLSPLFTIVETEHTGPITGIRVLSQNIEILKQEAVGNFSELNYVEIEDSGINLIKEGAFANLPKMKTVNLQRNKIKLIEDDAFFNAPSVVTLDLSYNELQYFEQDALGNMQKLYNLFLSFNSIENIHKESFTNLPVLANLNMSHNNILHVHKKAFNGIPALTSLDLSYNRISVLPNNVFVPTPNIVILNLFNNNLTYLSEEVLNSITKATEVVLLFNPFTCNCYDKIHEWSEGLGIDLQNRSYFECNTEADLRNIPVCVTTEWQDCLTNPEEDLYSILHVAQPEYECFAYNWHTYRDRQMYPNVNPKIFVDVYETRQASVRVEITKFQNTFRTGSDISFGCNVEGYPIIQVQWYKNGQPLYPSEAIQISDNHRLHIKSANQSDSGEYRCEAANEYSRSASSISITVEGLLYIDPNCTDNPYFANCALIVRGQYCWNNYYTKFCCKSCTEAGQLPLPNIAEDKHRALKEIKK